MANDIGPVTMRIVANAEGMKGGLDKAEAMSKATSRNIAADAKAAQGPASAPPSSGIFSSFLKGGAGGAASSAMAMAGPMAAAVVAGQKIKEKIDQAWQGIYNGIDRAAGLLKTLPGLLDQALLEPGKLLATAVSMVGSAISSFGDVAKKVGDTISPLFGGALAVPFKLLGAAVGVAGAGLGFLWDEFQKGRAILRDLAEASLKTGASVNDIRAIMIAAGPAAEGMDKAITKMFKAIANAELGSEEAAKAFERLGFSGMTAASKLGATQGSIQELAKLPLSGQILALAKAFEGMTDPALRAKTAMEIFGKSGAGILGGLSRIAAGGLENAKGLMERLGLSVSAGDMANVKKANEELKKMQLLREGITNQITLAVAPVVTGLVEAFQESSLSMAGLADKIIDGFEWASKAVAGFVDWIRAAGNEAAKFQLAGAGMKIVWLEMLADKERFFGNSDKADAFSHQADIERNKAKAIAEGIGSFDPDKAGKAVDEFFSKVRDRRKETDKGAAALDFLANADAMEAAAKKAAEIFGPEAVQQVEDYFKKMREGALSIKAELDEVAKSAAIKAELEKMKEPARAIGKELAGPLGELRDKLTEIERISKSGAFDALGVSASAAVGKAFADIGSKVKLPEVKFAGAASIDSAAAYSSIINFKFGDQGITVQERIEQLQREALQQSEIQTRNGVELLRILKDNPEALAGVI